MEGDIMETKLFLNTKLQSLMLIFVFIKLCRYLWTWSTIDEHWFWTAAQSNDRFFPSPRKCHIGQLVLENSILNSSWTLFFRGNFDFTLLYLSFNFNYSCFVFLVMTRKCLLLIILVFCFLRLTIEEASSDQQGKLEKEGIDCSYQASMIIK